MVAWTGGVAVTYAKSIDMFKVHAIYPMIDGM
jgi:hypothetical protein